MHVARDRVGRHTGLAHRVAGEAVLVLRTPHFKHAAVLRVEPAEVVNGFLRHLEKMVVGVFGAETVPRRLQPFVHALDGTESARRRRGAREVLAQHLTRPLARIVAALLVAREAVGAERSRHEPALALAGDLAERTRIAANAAAGEIPPEHLRPLPAGKTEFGGTERARLSVKRKRDRRARLLVRPEPGFHSHRLRRIVGVEPRAEVRAAGHQVRIVTLRTRLRLRDGLRQHGRGGDLFAVRIQRGDAVDGHRAAAVEVVGQQGERRGGQCRRGAQTQNNERSTHPITCLSLDLRLRARSSTRSPCGRRR